MDLKEPFRLPGGKIYGEGMDQEFTLRAPRLCDRGIGNLSSKRKVQAETLYVCLEPKPKVHPYDWHTSDYTAANLAQRIIARGTKMPLLIRCSNPDCGLVHEEQIELDKVKINPPKLPLNLTYKTKDNDIWELSYFTPRILDEIRANVKKFQKDFPEADQDISLQETARAIIKTVNGEKKPYTQMTSYLLNCYETDLKEAIAQVMLTNYGPVLQQTCVCPACKTLITFSISPDEG